MPIKLDTQLPALDILRSENVFIMDNERAQHQNIRPLEILIVNLMPTKEATEVQLLRLLANTPLQINVDFLYMESHRSKNTEAEYLETFYKTFDDIKGKFYDGMIITGAPVETIPFEEVDYWQELTAIFEWSKDHVYSTLHLCWGAQAALYHQYGIQKFRLPEKLSGVYEQSVEDNSSQLFRGFDDTFKAPHSRHTDISETDILTKTPLQILSKGKEVGVSILASSDLREVYSFGHLEYDRETLAKEFERDQAAGKAPKLPVGYFKSDNPEEGILMRWSLAASTFFSNWINYAVYQETPYLLEELIRNKELEEFNDLY
ncbi:homoserine O-acetyltransferase MetA [Streptococcus hyovaginalis]|uniref:homoserine O-acetyltransferase MetA n=2 Tax=Streptococcus hyovaginalis TaxID=149015 RepID=UPI002A90E62A|nr:homoserine O-succinyltransferase [Streptococcus hyovaginalis]MDY5974005.1 homoserine O-succinyltransferase [Streptococcus hyovaginalis]